MKNFLMWVGGLVGQAEEPRLRSPQVTVSHGLYTTADPSSLALHMLPLFRSTQSLCDEH